MGVLNKIWKSKGWFVITIAALVVINWLASMYHTRIDFTNEKRFTLSLPTKKVLQKLDDVVQVDVFLKGNFPSGFKKLANSTTELLQEFKEVAGKKLQYRFISPDENVEGTNVLWGRYIGCIGLLSHQSYIADKRRAAAAKYLPGSLCALQRKYFTGDDLPG
jgi:hypothetical protein